MREGFFQYGCHSIFGSGCRLRRNVHPTTILFTYEQEVIYSVQNELLLTTVSLKSPKIENARSIEEYPHSTALFSSLEGNFINLDQ
jgi:hypothetical protein